MMMNIPDNRISSVRKYIFDKLLDFYPQDEVQGISKILFKEFLNIEPHELILKANERMTESQILLFIYAIKDLKKHKPIQYITGKTEFYNCTIFVNENVLIPRPETEELVDLIVKDHHKTDRIKILDICTGSGCIAIALAKYLTNSSVTAIDVSEPALVVAKENAKYNQVAVDFKRTDILNLKESGEDFNIIVSNPPYVLEKEKDLMHANVLEYEPHLALFVKDDDPLVFYKAIADYALKNLSAGGKLYLEINEKKGQEVKELLENKGFREVQIKKDLSEKERIVRAIL
jgi:release factor glutamine methyltransferase